MSISKKALMAWIVSTHFLALLTKLSTETVKKITLNKVSRLDTNPVKLLEQTYSTLKKSGLLQHNPHKKIFWVIHQWTIELICHNGVSPRNRSWMASAAAFNQVNPNTTRQWGWFLLFQPGSLNLVQNPITAAANSWVHFRARNLHASKKNAPELWRNRGKYLNQS